MMLVWFVVHLPKNGMKTCRKESKTWQYPFRKSKYESRLNDTINIDWFSYFLKKIDCKLILLYQWDRLKLGNV